MKKVFALILTFLWMFTMNLYTSAVDEPIDNYHFLINQGYEEDYLDKLSDTTIQKMVEMIGDGYVSDIKTNETTFICNDSLARGNINSDNLILEISTGAISPSGSSTITGVLVAVYWEWGSFDPLYRGKDAVAVNWDKDLFVYVEDSFYAEDVHKHEYNDDWIIVDTYDVLSLANQGGIGHWTDLEEWTEYVAGMMVFLLEPTERMVKGNTYTTSINVEYTHEKAGWSGLSLTILDFGIGANWNFSCDTMADTSIFKFSR